VLLCLTANHRNTGFEILDRLSRVAVPRATELARELPDVRGAVVLATCNRFEAYLDVDDRVPAEAATETVLDAVVDAGDADELRASLEVLTGTRAAEHLFAVTSGLESMAVGEDEIAGQVGRALETARAAGATSSLLEQVFQHATHTSRHVRAATALGGRGRSLVRLALELASSRVPDWRAARVLIVGTGRYAATTIHALHDLGAADVRVYSATGRAAAFAARYGLTSVGDLPAAIADADVVVTCTSRYTVTADDMAPGHRVLAIDLGLPRNIDAAVAGVPGVELLDLETIGRHAPLGLTAETDARALVSDAVDRYTAARAAAPAIVALRTRVDEVVEAEVERLRAAGVDESAIQAVRHAAAVLLHEPSVRAREFAAAGRTAEFERAVETLFGVRVEPAEQRRLRAVDPLGG